MRLSAVAKYAPGDTPAQEDTCSAPPPEPQPLRQPSTVCSISSSADMAAVLSGEASGTIDTGNVFGATAEGGIDGKAIVSVLNSIISVASTLTSSGGCANPNYTFFAGLRGV